LFTPSLHTFRIGHWRRPSRRPQHLIMSCGLGWGAAWWFDLPHPPQPVCQQHAHSLPPCQASPLHGRHGHHSHIKQAMLVSYLESYLSKLQRRLSEWRIGIYVTNSTTITFMHARWRFIQPRPVTLSRSQTNVLTQLIWGGGGHLDKQLTWSSHINQVRKKTSQMMGCWVPYWTGEVISPLGMESCYTSSVHAQGQNFL
jgi:hypothetical protein